MLSLNNRISLLLVLIFVSCKSKSPEYIYGSNTLKIEQLSPNTFRHISYLSTETYGVVSCNGMLVIDNGEAIIVDTPTVDSISSELIEWIEADLNCKTIGVVVTHFHIDCLGGINEFHTRSIPSYASFKTIELASKDSVSLPQIGFENKLEIPVGNNKLLCSFLGEGHTVDNIVSYYPPEKALFGGCLVKSLGASKGNLNDANIAEWSNTIQTVKSTYQDAQIIIPGHGNPGNKELLDYTFQLFKVE